MKIVALQQSSSAVYITVEYSLSAFGDIKIEFRRISADVWEQLCSSKWETTHFEHLEKTYQEYIKEDTEDLVASLQSDIEDFKLDNANLRLVNKDQADLIIKLREAADVVAEAHYTFRSL